MKVFTSVAEIERVEVVGDAHADHDTWMMLYDTILNESLSDEIHLAALRLANRLTGENEEVSLDAVRKMRAYILNGD